VNRHIKTGNGKRIDERAISLFIRLGHVEGLGGVGGRRMGRRCVCLVCCLFLSLACALRTLFVAPIPSHRLFSW
jgi:hypothetical protein